MAFAERLAAAMASKDVGIRELGRRSGVDPSNISKLLKGDQSPTGNTVEALAGALGVHTWELMDDARPEWSPEVLSTAAELERLKPNVRRRVLPLVHQIVSTYADPRPADEQAATREAVAV